MIDTGLVSITFRTLAPAEIVALVRQAGLDGIEWGGDVHVPHGDLATARAVARLTREAGLRVTSYGSYYRAAVSGNEGLSFAAVLETARELGAPLVRVWAGRGGSAAMSDGDRGRVVADLQRVGELAAAQGVRIALEWHGNTLTDTSESARALMTEVAHLNVRLYWQPATALSRAARLAGLRSVLDFVTNVHVFHWEAGADGSPRRPLAEGRAEWRDYLALLHETGRDRCALLEFVRGDEPAQCLEDAATLKRWLAALGAGQGGTDER